MVLFPYYYYNEWPTKAQVFNIHMIENLSSKTWTEVKWVISLQIFIEEQHGRIIPLSLIPKNFLLAAFYNNTGGFF